MAEEKGKDVELELDGAGKKKKMMMIIIAVVVIAAGAGGYFFLMGGESEEQMEAALDSEPVKSAAAKPSAKQGNALYVPMPRPFRFNVPGAVRDRFVEIRVQLLVRGAESEEKAKMHIPLIENTLLNVFSQGNADDLATRAGKASLKQKSLAAVQNIMADVEGDKTIESVLFTGFVMQ